MGVTQSRFALAALTVLAGGCSRLLGLEGDYRIAPDVAEDAGKEPRDAGLTADAGEQTEDTGVPLGGPDAGPFEMPEGKLVYHRYSDYFAGDSEMFIVEFPSGERSAELGATYGLCNPLSGIFSPDGTRLVLGAQPREGDSCPPTDVSELEIYILDLERPGVKQRVTDNDVEDQDPQFSFRGDFLVFKHDLGTAEWPVGGTTFTTCDALPEGARCYASMPETSKPVITPDDETICYYEGHHDESDIYCFERARALAESIDAVRKPAAVHRDVNDYRPTVDETHLYYVRGRSPTDSITYIARTPLENLSTVSERAPFCTDVTANYDDPCTLGDDVLVYTSDKDGLGGRDLFVADFAGRWRFSLDDFSPGLNSEKHDTGPDFWRAQP